MYRTRREWAWNEQADQEYQAKRAQLAVKGYVTDEEVCRFFAVNGFDGCDPKDIRPMMLDAITERSLSEGEACHKCGYAMTPGRALVGAPRGFTYEGEWPVKLADCTKCHTCGYSETVPGAETHFVVPKAH